MCNFKGNLVAWMDGELNPEVAANVESHLEICGECRRRLDSYKGVSRDFAAYHLAKAQLAVVPAHRIPRWVPYTAAAATVLIATLLALPRPNQKAPEVRETAKVNTSAPIELIGGQPAVHPNPSLKVASHHPVARHQSRHGESSVNQAAIQIAIPADAMFPPGAVPEGLAYVASLAPDGSIQSIRLQP